MLVVVHTLYTLPGGEKFFTRTALSEKGTKISLCTAKQYVNAAYSRGGRCSRKAVQPWEIPSETWEALKKTPAFIHPEAPAIVEKYGRDRAEWLARNQTNQEVAN